MLVNKIPHDVSQVVYHHIGVLKTAWIWIQTPLIELVPTSTSDSVFTVGYKGSSLT